MLQQSHRLQEISEGYHFPAEPKQYPQGYYVQYRYVQRANAGVVNLEKESVSVSAYNDDSQRIDDILQIDMERVDGKSSLVRKTAPTLPADLSDKFAELPSHVKKVLEAKPA